MLKSSKVLRPHLSVVLATRNEEANIGRCLESVQDIADEIIIADEQSTDGTLDVIKNHTAKVILVPHHDNFHVAKNVAIDAAHGDWILQLDADEVVSPELATEIVNQIRSNPPENGFWIHRRNWFLSRVLTKGGQYPDPTLRLYRRGKGRLPAHDVHEQAVVEGPVGKLSHDLLHYRDTSFAKYLQGFNRYSIFMSTKLHHPNPVNFLLIKPIVTFLNIYFRHKGFVDGVPGFVFALFSGLIFPAAYINYWQSKSNP